MVKKLVFTKPDFSVDILTVEDGDFQVLDATVPKKHFEEQLKSFQGMQEELLKLIDSSRNGDSHPAARFLRSHGVWLSNLANTGFAIDYAQFVRES